MVQTGKLFPTPIIIFPLLFLLHFANILLINLLPLLIIIIPVTLFLLFALFLQVLTFPILSLSPLLLFLLVIDQLFRAFLLAIDLDIGFFGTLGFSFVIFYVLLALGVVHLAHLLVCGFFLGFVIGILAFGLLLFGVHVSLEISLHFDIIIFLFPRISIPILLFILIPLQLLLKLNLIANILRPFMRFPLPNAHPITYLLCTRLFTLFLIFFDAESIFLQV